MKAYCCEVSSYENFSRVEVFFFYIDLDTQYTEGIILDSIFLKNIQCSLKTTVLYINIYCGVLGFHFLFSCHSLESSFCTERNQNLMLTTCVSFSTPDGISDVIAYAPACFCHYPVSPKAAAKKRTSDKHILQEQMFVCCSVIL